MDLQISYKNVQSFDSTMKMLLFLPFLPSRALAFQLHLSPSLYVKWFQVAKCNHYTESVLSFNLKEMLKIAATLYRRKECEEKERKKEKETKTVIKHSPSTFFLCERLGSLFLLSYFIKIWYQLAFKKCPKVTLFLLLFLLLRVTWQVKKKNIYNVTFVTVCYL